MARDHLSLNGGRIHFLNYGFHACLVIEVRLVHQQRIHFICVFKSAPFDLHRSFSEHSASLHICLIINLRGLVVNSAHFRFIITLDNILRIDTLENGVWLLTGLPLFL